MDNDNDLHTVGGRIRWAITKHLGIRQADAARRLEIKPGQLSRWITDPSRQPNDESLGKIAELTGIPRAWLRYGGELEEASVAAPRAAYRRPTGVLLLRERPRRLYAEFMGELFAEGCDREAMERASGLLLAPIVATQDLSEDMQEEALRSLMGVARAAASAPPQPGPKREPGAEESEATEGEGQLTQDEAQKAFDYAREERPPQDERQAS